MKYTTIKLQHDTDLISELSSGGQSTWSLEADSAQEAADHAARGADAAIILVIENDLYTYVFEFQPEHEEAVTLPRTVTQRARKTYGD